QKRVREEGAPPGEQAARAETRVSRGATSPTDHSERVRSPASFVRRPARNATARGKRRPDSAERGARRAQRGRVSPRERDTGGEAGRPVPDRRGPRRRRRHRGATRGIRDRRQARSCRGDRREGESTGLSEQGERVGINEALFREVNERIDQLHDELGGAKTFEIVCECGDASCIERFSISSSDYEQLRGDVHRFALVPGHERSDVERVVKQRKDYFVVEKTDPDAARAAEELA